MTASLTDPSVRFDALGSSSRKIQPNVRLPLTEDFAARELTLPLYPSLSVDQVDAIVYAVVDAFETVRSA